MADIVFRIEREWDKGGGNDSIQVDLGIGMFCVRIHNRDSDSYIYLSSDECALLGNHLLTLGQSFHV